MLRFRSVADGLLGLFVPKLTAAAGPPCQDLIEYWCAYSARCASNSSPWYVQAYQRVCNTCYGCGYGWQAGCCSV
ncbi:hypothetical protein [Virgisporangium aurantiacum]|uniref:Uncharacterized protein n=1 Tax=Virgisporangium aurantiacum TaxID=175570 RepID=A0A8J3Z2W5_9ACTN|nr:hypothetical protein [Virgisporangium aurantiacum]GIJ54065.1 hypothetical protein Vau01_015810 [Virgisporangium aurantiacum]